MAKISQTYILSAFGRLKLCLNEFLAFFCGEVN